MRRADAIARQFAEYLTDFVASRVALQRLQVREEFLIYEMDEFILILPVLLCPRRPLVLCINDWFVCSSLCLFEFLQLRFDALEYLKEEKP